MPKQILPQELAEIVTGLLVKPDLLGELESKEQHQEFMLDIGRVIAGHCGGQVNRINPGDGEDRYPTDWESLPSLSVSPNDSLPSVEKNVWSHYDPQGWEDYFPDSDDVEAPELSQPTQDLRSQLQSLLCNSAL